MLFFGVGRGKDLWTHSDLDWVWPGNGHIALWVLGHEGNNGFVCLVGSLDDMWLW